MFRASLGTETGAELRLLERHHAEALFALVDRNRARLREWLPWVDDTDDVAAVLGFIEGALAQFARGAGFHCGLWVDGELGGVVGTHEIDAANRSVSLGYWIGERFGGRGLITRACRRIIDHVFDELGLVRVSIHCATENPRSCAIPERLGFVREGVLRSAERLYDRHVDLVVYGMLATDWAGGTGQ